MTEHIREQFEELMRERSSSDLKINRFGNYQSTTIQSKWKYFQYGYQAAMTTSSDNQNKTSTPSKKTRFGTIKTIGSRTIHTLR